MNFRRFCRRAQWGAGGIIFAMLSVEELPGAEPANPTPPGAAVPSVREIRPGEFQIGEVQLSQERREIRFPATVNLREGNIEYVLVTATGKTHESLLRTTVEPLHVQLAFVLLGAKGAANAPLSLNPADPIPGEKVSASLVWTEAGRTNRAEATAFVLDRKSGAAIPVGHWTYTGSRLRDNGFAAQLDGSILSLITDPDALINNPRPGREDDDNWLVRTNGLPPLGTPVEVQLRLAK